MTTHGRLHLVNTLLLATLCGGSLLVWPELPDRIPGHFGLGGEVTRWEPPSLMRWMLLPLTALALVVMNYGLAALLPRRPGLFNHPDKDTFLALPAATQAPVIARMRTLLYGLSALLTAVFGLLQWTRYRTAHGADPELYVALMLLLGVVSAPIALAVWLPPISRKVREQARREAEAGAAE